MTPVRFTSYLPYNCPEKLRKSINDCSSSSDVLDTLLKFLGDSSNDSMINSVVELILNAAMEFETQPSEIEFTILSLQNIFNGNNLKVDIQSKILIIMTSLLLTQDHDPELTSNVVDFLLKLIENKTESTLVQQFSLDSLIEIELCYPEILARKEYIFRNLLCFGVLSDKAAELLSLIVKNSTKTEDQESRSQTLILLLEKLPSLSPLTMASVAVKMLDLCKRMGFQLQLELTLKSLLERYSLTFNMCILQTITLLQELSHGITKENAVLQCCTQPGLSVARNLIALDWLAKAQRLNEDCFQIEQFEPTPFDGADARLKKIILLNKILRGHPQGMSIFRGHLDQLINNAIKTGTSRSIAAVFRVMHNMLETDYPASSTQIALDCTVEMATRYPPCLPHVVDFLKFVGGAKLERLSPEIFLNLIDAYDDMDTIDIEAHVEYLIPFFIEASSHQYEFCQPRVILRIIKRFLEKKDSKIIVDSSQTLATLELCQALIRNQDYGIFQPELNSVLSLMQALHKRTDIKHRTWMLRSLITHVNTDSLKDAFDVDMDLSKIGQIEYVDFSLVDITILLDTQVDATQPLNWSPERKRLNRSIYFSLEIRMTKNVPDINYSEFIGIRIDFTMDPTLGQADSIYIPMLQSDQMKKSYVHIQPKICAPIVLKARATLSTTDGRIFVSELKEFHLLLEHILNPLSNSETSKRLWIDCEAEQHFHSSIFSLNEADRFLSAVEHGALTKFQMAATNADDQIELAFVTPHSLLILMRVVSVKSRYHIEILVEDASLLSVAFTLLSSYSS